jgi:hypothetical protein
MYSQLRIRYPKTDKNGKKILMQLAGSGRRIGKQVLTFRTPVSLITVSVVYFRDTVAAGPSFRTDRNRTANEHWGRA